MQSEIWAFCALTCQHAESREAPSPCLSPTHSSLQACKYLGKIRQPYQGDATANITAGASAYGPTEERAKRADTIQHRSKPARVPRPGIAMPMRF